MCVVTQTERKVEVRVREGERESVCVVQKLAWENVGASMKMMARRYGLVK